MTMLQCSAPEKKEAKLKIKKFFFRYQKKESKQKLFIKKLHIAVLPDNRNDIS